MQCYIVVCTQVWLEIRIFIDSPSFVVPSNTTSAGKVTDCGQLFSPAVWPAKSATKAVTSVQPRQVAQECVNVSWAAFRNIFKAVPGLQIKWPLLRIFFEYQSTLTIILKFLSH